MLKTYRRIGLSYQEIILLMSNVSIRFGQIDLENLSSLNMRDNLRQNILAIVHLTL